MSAEDHPMLPGFEPPRPGENRIVLAATRQLQKLAEDDLLTEDHAIVSQLVLALAQAVGGTIAGGKLTVAGVQGAKLLLEALEQLPRGDDESGMQALVSELRAVS